MGFIRLMVSLPEILRMTKEVRVRFAPSPTGPLHIGGVRTALFNYLFARKHKGTFILRIEDTDQNRYVEGAEDYIRESLLWCGLEIDEGPQQGGPYGPYRQSERKAFYREYAEELLKKGAAYYAFDTPEELQTEREKAEKEGSAFTYCAANRDQLHNSLALREKETEKRIQEGQPYVIRFKNPTDSQLQFADLVRGDLQVDTAVLDDKILFKSDGMPTYHLANVVDDHLMEISHVIRGEEWLPSLPLHVQLYQALGWDAPEFAHLPLILKPSGNGKLSKRDGEKGGFPVFPLNWNDSPGYKESGYDAPAMVNFLAFLGWNPGTEQELFSLSELIESFSLERVQKAGARFDPEKIKWFNQKHLQQKSTEELLADFKALATAKDWSEFGSKEDSDLLQMMELLKERLVFLEDFKSLSAFFFQAPTDYDPKAAKKQWKETTPALMRELKSRWEAEENFSAEHLQSGVKNWCAENEIGLGKVMAPLRLSMVGSLQGPDLFQSIELLGKEESLKRIDQALASL